LGCVLIRRGKTPGSSQKYDPYNLDKLLCKDGQYFWSFGDGVKSIKRLKLIPDPASPRGSKKQIAVLDLEVYPVAYEPIGITWGDGYLWTMQTSCENWHHKGHIYRIKIGDCPVTSPEPPMPLPTPFITPYTKPSGEALVSKAVAYDYSTSTESLMPLQPEEPAVPAMTVAPDFEYEEVTARPESSQPPVQEIIQPVQFEEPAPPSMNGEPDYEYEELGPGHNIRTIR